VAGPPLHADCWRSHGDDIVKSSASGDEERCSGAFRRRRPTRPFSAVNRGKERIGIDMHGRRTRRAGSAAEDADILVENYLPGPWTAGTWVMTSSVGQPIRGWCTAPSPLRRRWPAGGLPGYDDVLRT